MKTVTRTRVFARLGVATVVLGLGWWLFGFRIQRTRGTTIVARRVFGRVTRVHIFEGLHERERILLDWSDPYGGDPATECAAIFPQRWLDLNGDGRWDTWLKRLGPDPTGHCLVQYQVDTADSGRPDWVFALPFNEYQKGTAMMKRRRGF
jgi:hypothetical protein